MRNWGALKYPVLGIAVPVWAALLLLGTHHLRMDGFVAGAALVASFPWVALSATKPATGHPVLICLLLLLNAALYWAAGRLSLRWKPQWRLSLGVLFYYSLAALAYAVIVGGTYVFGIT